MAEEVIEGLVRRVKQRSVQETGILAWQEEKTSQSGQRPKVMKSMHVSIFLIMIWAEAMISNDGTEKYGKIYCDMIDQTIAKGFSDDLECIHDKRQRSGRKGILQHQGTAGLS